MTQSRKLEKGKEYEQDEVEPATPTRRQPQQGNHAKKISDDIGEQTIDEQNKG